MTTLIGAAAAAFAFSASGVASAATFYVSPSGSDSNACSSSGAACLTIGSAIGKASAGDTIQVAAGTYNENLSINKSLTLNGPNASVAALSGTSRGDEAVVGATGNTNSRVVIGTSASVTLAGFKFVGPTSGSAGIGVQVSGSTTSGEIKNNWFYKLTKPNVTVSGGDIFIQNGTPTGWKVTGNLHDGSGNWAGGDSPTSNWTAINVWSATDSEISGNLIRNYERGIQTEGSGRVQTGVVIKSNRIEDTVYHAIQAANQNVGTKIIGNTIVRSQLGAAWSSQPYDGVYYGGVGWYCTGAIRLWTNSTSSGFVVENNKITETGGTLPGYCPDIAAVGTNASAISSIKNNSIGGSSAVGFIWGSVQVTNVGLSGNVVTMETTSGNGFAVGDSVTVSGVGAPFDGTYTVTGKPDGYTLTYAKTAANVARRNTDARTAPTVMKSTQVGAITLGQNWWGSNNGPGSTGASVNGGGASTIAAPWTVSYTDGTADAGYDPNLGFWPSATTASSAPANTAVPTISGTARVGQTLTLADGTWTGAPTPTYAYKWQRSDNGTSGWADVGGATSSTYQLKGGDADKYIRAVVTATSAAGSAEANSLSSGQIARPSTVYVKADGSDSEAGTTTGSALSTIQAGVNLVASGGTVNVAAGTYTGQVRITKSLSLVGTGSTRGDVVIKAPATAVDFLSTGTRPWNVYPVVGVTGGATANISNLRIDGDSKAGLYTSASPAGRFVGLAYFGAGGTVDNVNVVDIRQPFKASPEQLEGNQTGYGIYGNTSAAETGSFPLVIKNSTIERFQKSGIVAGAEAMPLTIEDSEILCSGEQINTAGKTAIAQNGVVTNNQSATTVDELRLTGSTITGCGRQPTDGNGSAALIYHRSLTTTGVHIANNRIADSDYLLFLSPVVSNARATVVKNSFTGVRKGGPSVWNYSYSGATNYPVAWDGNYWGCTEGPNPFPDVAACVDTGNFGGAGSDPSNYIKSFSLDSAKAGKPGWWPNEPVPLSGPSSKVTFSGELAVGKVLAADAGTWTGQTGLNFRWQYYGTVGGVDDWYDIPGATSQTYTVGTAYKGSYLRVVFDGAENTTSGNLSTVVDWWSAPSGFVYLPESDSQGPVAYAPESGTAPTVDGTGNVGATLTTTDGGWDGEPAPTLSRRWQRAASATGPWSDISGATGASYRLTADDEGKFVRSVISGTNSQGTLDNASAATGPIDRSSSVFVDPTGDDEQSGSVGSPVKTVQRGLDLVKTGGTVNIKAGTYNEDVTVSKRVTLKGSGSGTKTIAGTSAGTAAVTVSAAASGSAKVNLQELTVTAASGKKGIAVTQPNVEIDGVTVGGSGSVGVEYSGANLGTATTGSFVRNIKVGSGFSTAGVQVAGSGTLKILLSSFSNTTSGGVPAVKQTGGVGGASVDARDNWWGTGSSATAGGERPDNGVLIAGSNVDDTRWIRSYTPTRTGDAGFWPADVVAWSPPAAPDLAPAVDTHVETSSIGSASATTVTETAVQSPVVVQPPFVEAANETAGPGGTAVTAETPIKLVVEPNKADPATTSSFSSSGTAPTGSKFVDIEFRDIVTDEKVNLAGPFTVCLVPEVAGQRLWHFEDGKWADITNRRVDAAGDPVVEGADPASDASWAARDETGGRICGQVSHFSPFGVAADEYAAAPTVSLDGWTNPTSDTTPSFTFDGEPGASFICSLDGSDYVDCNSPATLTSYTISPALADGSHTLRVKQTDVANNTSAAQVVTFEVDTIDPDAPGVELFTPASASQSVADTGTYTSETDARVEFSSHDPDTVTFECNIDSAGWGDCESPLTGGLTGLSDGLHTVLVRQTDEAGNVSDPSTVSWTVDTVAPGNVTGLPSWTSASTFRDSDSESFTFALPTPDTGSPLSAVCSVDGGPDEDCDSSTGHSLDNLSDGVHSLKVTVVDAAGNRSSGVTISWTTDTEVPESPELELFTPSTSTVAVDPTGTFTKSDSAKITIGNVEAGASVSCTLNDGSGPVAVTPCGSPSKTLSSLADGEYTFTVTQTDAAGNESASASVSWTVDNEAPTFADNLASSRNDQTNFRSATLTWAADDNASDPADVVAECALYKNGAYGSWNRCSSPKTVSNLPFGEAKFKVRLRDQAGNETTGGDIQEVEWTVVRLGVDAAPIVQSGSPLSAVSSRDDLGVGTQLTAQDPEFTGETVDDTDQVRWERCSSSLTSSCTTVVKSGTPSDANYNRYTPTASDINSRLRYVVVRTTDDGSTVTTASGMTGVVIPVVDAKASISGTTSDYDGAAGVKVPAGGQKLTAVDNTWTSLVGGRTTLYRWQRCTDSTKLKDIEASCKTISGSAGTASTYTPGSSDVGRRLRVLTGVCISSTAPATSCASTAKFVWSASDVTEPVRVVAVNVDAPTLVYRGGLSAPKRLSSVSVKAGAWRYTLGGKFTYQWQRCSSGSCADIAGATRSTYVPTATDVAKGLRVRVVYTGRDGTKVTVHTATSGNTAS